MKKLLVLVVVVALSGCSARYQAGVSSQTSPGGGSGTSITSTRGGLSVQAGSNSFAAAILAIALLAGAIEQSRNPQPMPSPSALFPESAPPAPELTPNRRVVEQDCTKPLEDPGANLKCR